MIEDALGAMNFGPLKISLERRDWPLHSPFAVSRGTRTQFETLQVTLRDAHGRIGRGETCPVYYAGEDVRSLWAVIDACRDGLESGPSRESLLDLMPRSSARFALDSALWDLEAQRCGRSVWDLVGIAEPRPLQTAYSIGIRSLSGYAQTAAERRDFSVLKVKVGATDPIEAVAAVHAAAPSAALIVDPNQSWDIEALRAYAPVLKRHGTVLIEQPIPVGTEMALDAYNCPVLLCADELIDDESDLGKARGRFDVINIKLEKTGGLTAALRLARTAKEAGFGLMVGCMGGSSLSMAPAAVLGQICDFVDLDGPLLLERDWPRAISYRSGCMDVRKQQLWGTGRKSLQIGRQGFRRTKVP